MQQIDIMAELASCQGEGLPLLDKAVPAGFPSPAESYAELAIDLNRHLIHHKEATFLVRVKGDSMTGFGIHSGDLLVIDRALPVVDGAVVLAVLDGEFTLKQFRRQRGQIHLCAGNPAYADIQVKDTQQLEIWGVATWSLHHLINRQG